MMDTNEIGAFGFAIALIAYSLLTILLLSGWRRSGRTRFLVMATAANTIWAGVWMFGFLDFTREYALVTAVEWSRGLVWLLAAIAILKGVVKLDLVRQFRTRKGMSVTLVALLPVVYLISTTSESPISIIWFAGGFVLSLLIVLTAEQLYRNAPVETRAGMTYLCIAIAGMFLFDLIMYSLVIAGKVPEPDFWAARGFVNVVLVPPLILGIRRRYRKNADAQVPRQIVFYSFGIVCIAIYAVVIIFGLHYVQTYGGSWSAVGGIVLIVAAGVSAVILLASPSIRARARVFLMKTFLQYKYDYRKEWLRFIATLSKSGLKDVGETAVRAVAQIVNSPGGAVWIEEPDTNSYLPVGSWRCEMPRSGPITADSGLVKFLLDRQWVIDLEEMKRYPDRYENLQLDGLRKNGADWWLVVPLFLSRRLYGFIVLQKPRVVPSLNFEDHDLLRTVGSHVGMHINQTESDRRLAESRQFGAYDRLTAFLMHDLNNLIAQQSLVVKNAERFRDNPKFVDDAIETIAHSVNRMKRLMEQLNADSKVTMMRETDLREALSKAISRCDTRKPKPEAQIAGNPIFLSADPERLTTVFEHIIRNAQDATDPNGQICVDVDVAKGEVHVSIRDSGEGMSAEFIRERLFRPFDSTKGSQSMGIGAYQARDYVRILNGQLEVSSEIGVGSEFSIRLPIPE